MTAKISVALPVYNEESVLEKGVTALRDFLAERIADPWEIVIADNGSTDSTLEKAKGLSSKYPEVKYIHLDQKGRGRALKRAWSESDADIVSYMDIDLSTGLEAFPALIESLKKSCDLAIGSRFAKGARVKRGPKREILSRGYMLLLKFVLGVGFSDAQCGFKGVTRKVVKDVMPNVKDNEWFFDTELLYRSQRMGYRIKEVPVTWVENQDSRVKIVKTVTNYVISVIKLRMEYTKNEKRI